MTMVPSLQRLALVLAIIPQLIVMGLGQGVVVCIAPGGHMQVEVLANECCAGATPAPAARDRADSVSHEEPDCGSCSDYQILMDLRVSRSSRTGSFEHSPNVTAALPVEFARVPVAERANRSRERHLERGRVPRHLESLRSVMLRC